MSRKQRLRVAIKRHVVKIINAGKKFLVQAALEEYIYFSASKIRQRGVQIIKQRGVSSKRASYRRYRQGLNE
jgi:hypothetical protein